MTHQQLLEQANRRVKSNTNRQFVRKSNDAQMLDRLVVAAKATIDAWNGDSGARIDDTLRELRAVVRVAEQRKK